MNNLRRENLQVLLTQLAEIQDTLEVIKDQEEEYCGNIPENLQGSERSEKAGAACDSLDEAVSNLEEAVDNIRNAIE